MDSMTWDDIRDGQNNVWYERNDADTVVVMVHGLFSQSKYSWLFAPKEAGAERVFWLDLIKSDARFGNPSLFLGGYHTGVGSGLYQIENCADELYSALTRPDAQGKHTVMEYPNIVFVGHSMGGIVSRYILTRYWERFQHKKVGLVLIASPSGGAVTAEWLRGLAELYNQRQAQQLTPNSDFLKGLDRDFRNLLSDNKIPCLVGMEACEEKHIVHRRLLPPLIKQPLVTQESAGKYFQAVRMLRDTDHMDSVKPDSLDHPAHQFLVDFWQKYHALNCPEEEGEKGRKGEGETREQDDAGVGRQALGVSPQPQTVMPNTTPIENQKSKIEHPNPQSPTQETRAMTRDTVLKRLTEDIRNPGILAQAIAAMSYEIDIAQYPNYRTRAAELVTTADNDGRLAELDALLTDYTNSR